MNTHLISILALATLAFIFTLLWTPLLTHFLYKYRLGKKIRNAGLTPVFSALHAHKAGTPTMGGLLVWVTTLIFALAFSLLAYLWPGDWTNRLNFLSRQETWLPLAAFVASAIVGLFDDWLDIRGRGVFGGGGMTIKKRLLVYTVIAAVGAYWFYYKLGRENFHVPFLGSFSLGWSYILIFISVIVSTAFSVNETDGLDGLAGGVLLTSFASYGIISFVSGLYDLASFCAVIAGALLAFLWFNIPPARFYMGDTGAMGMGVTLGVIAMLTDSVLILPIIGLVFVMESMSVIIQLTSKKLRGKKVFHSSPIHHHFEALGWSEAKIVMRFWVISGMSSALALIIFFLDSVY